MNYQAAVDYIRSQTGFRPESGIILGTGLGDLVDQLEITANIDYEQIPGFPVSTVETHKGRLIFGELNGAAVVVMQGRFHHYEGYSLQEIAFPVRVLKLLSIKRLFISNVSGGINPEYRIGDLVVIKDHINLLGGSPLTGKNADRFGERFPDMLHAYDPEMTDEAYRFAIESGYRVRKGVYACVAGPQLETPAEYHMLRVIGADLVGMSTVPEVIAARHAGLPVAAISIVTDLGIVGSIKPVDIREIIAVAGKVQPKLCKLITHLVTQSSTNSAAE